MARKEVFATTGTRLMVRVFGGFDFSRRISTGLTLPRTVTRKACRWAATQDAAAGKVPTLLIRAMRDPDGANLDRIQVIKGWLDAAGKPQEKVYDVAWSGNRKPDASGKLPAVGNTVNVDEATYDNSIGSPVLQASGRIRTSIRSSAPSTTSALWKSRHRGGRPTTRSFQGKAADRRSRFDSGARLHLAHLVYA